MEGMREGIYLQWRFDQVTVLSFQEVLFVDVFPGLHLAGMLWTFLPSFLPLSGPSAPFSCSALQAGLACPLRSSWVCLGGA